MSHTKRTAEFQAECRSLAQLLQSGARLTTGELNRIAEILFNNTTDSSCIVKAKDDEPIFTLKGSDETSDVVVLEWVWRQGAKRLQKIEPSEKLKGKLEDARQCAREMQLYPSRKRAD